jgi:hypothetical protein
MRRIATGTVALIVLMCAFAQQEAPVNGHLPKQSVRIDWPSSIEYWRASGIRKPI